MNINKILDTLRKSNDFTIYNPDNSNIIEVYIPNDWTVNMNKEQYNEFIEYIKDFKKIYNKYEIELLYDIPPFDNKILPLEDYVIAIYIRVLELLSNDEINELNKEISIINNRLITLQNDLLD